MAVSKITIVSREMKEKMARTVKEKRKVSQAASQFGMVATASPTATDAGVTILARGGNAVDAAVAAAFCLGVTEPQASGIGGQSMALLYFAEEGRTVALDGSSRAPLGFSPRNIPKKPLIKGLKASTLPSTPAVLGYLLDTYGTMSLSEVLEPAVSAATYGFPISALQHRFIKRESKELLKDPICAARFFNEGRPLGARDTLRQPELGACLLQMAKEGWEDFYRGGISDKIIEDMEDRGGLLSRIDLNRIPLPVERPVLRGKYRGYRIRTFPPPGSGRALIAIMNILENFDPKELSPDSPDGAIILALSFWRALRDRDRTPSDPDIFPQLKKKPMLRERYAQRVAQQIRMVSDREKPGQAEAVENPGETTHLSVVDGRGNAVAITQSIELIFGSKRAAKDLGFFYNNYMSTFNYKDMVHPHYLLPGAAPWSSVAPTMVFRGKKPILVLGSPGSERITTAIALVISRMIDGKESLEGAVAGPRLHTTREGHVHIELSRFAPEVREALEGSNLMVVKKGSYSFYLGAVQAVQYPNRPGSPYVGIADPRRDGTARGPDGIFTGE